MKQNRRLLTKGFTLTEVIVVLAITSIVAAVAVPSLLAFVQHGKQIDRMNIARTLYLGAQSRLTELKVTKNLETFAQTTDGNVHAKLKDANFPSSDIANKDYVFYISKKKGETRPTDPVIQLLDPVIMDKTILQDAILIEYNIKTGIVLSAFYGDMVNDRFIYEGTGDDSVMGRRGMGDGGYAYAEARKQGYYGVGHTGSLDDIPSSLINVYDSYDAEHPLPDDTSYPLDNVLYAEIYIPQDQLGGTFDLLINDKIVEKNVPLATQTNGVDTLRQALLSYVPLSYSNTALVYRDADYLDEDYARFIWVLDYVGGDMSKVENYSSNAKHSIGVKYKYTNAGEVVFDGTSNLRVGIQGSIAATSFTEAHPYFATEYHLYSGNRYTVMSARHLYNIRYLPGGNFTQKADINLAAAGPYHSINNFAPIPTFAGIYAGTGYPIKNLTIDSPDDHVGLFATISGHGFPILGYTQASVIGLTLENPDITGNNNVGSVCGSLDGFITGIYVRYTDASKSIRGVANVGGIVGANHGTVTDSTFISRAATAHMSGTGTDQSKVGGIAGVNEAGAELKRILFLAIAPENGQTINPIVGVNSSSTSNISKLYYLSGLGLRPDQIPADSGTSDYNTENNNYVGEGIGTFELYNTPTDTLLSIGDWQKNDSLSEDDVLGTANTIYPYPFSKYSATQTAAFPDWPIVDGGKIEFNNIAYYEKYKDGSCGLWFLNNGKEQNLLKNNQEIIEAGYLVISDRNINTAHFFARTGDKAGQKEDGSTVEWNAHDRVVKLKFEDKSDLAIGVSQVTKRDRIWVAPLPLDELYALEKQSEPLQIMYSTSASGNKPKELEGFLQPLFAKGLYEKLTDAHIPDPQEFFIRTPWQMKNIGVLNTSTAVKFSEGNSYTLGKTFRQELDLNFTHTGIGVNVCQGSTVYSDLTQPAIVGEFFGTYDGGGKAVSNVVIHTPASDNIGLFSINSGTIKKVKLKDSSLTGRQSVGGIAGSNLNTISSCGVEYSTVFGSGMTGGIVGNNANSGSSKVEDVYFLSTADLHAVPISSVGGGIVGSNGGNVTRALYLAPAPSSVSGNVTTIYPIVRSGNPSDKLSQEANAGETCFYLSGYKYALDKSLSDKGVSDKSFVWTENTYNLLMPSGTSTIETSGGGTGILSKFLEIVWLDVAYGVDFSAWSQGSFEWSNPSSGYPYPIIDGMAKPTRWSLTDSPVRPDQLDRTDWETTLATSNRASNLDFINGDFELDLMNPDNFSNTYKILRTTQITSAPSSQSDVFNGGFTTGIGDPPSPSARNGSDYYGMYTYFDARWVPGWNTRPVNTRDASNIYANMIEFQRPYSSSLASSGRYGRVRTNYKGGLDGAYIELNADVPGTLYQICATVPETEMYYSFYHARRNAGNETAGNQRMNFYLSSMVNQNGDWVYANGTGRPTILRPCITPRGTGLSQSTTRNTVVYGNTGTAANEPVSVTRVDFYDPKGKTTRNAYLYDVWVSNLGYGITFWSDRHITNIPIGGVSNISNLSADAAENIIGYWHVEQFASNQYSEWKQYYGLYTVPTGQITTEFAYESASTRNEKEGNYLDGITFKSPGFLSIEKYAKMKVMIGGIERLIDVMYVKPGDTVTVELHVKSWGESPVNNIVIKDQFAPYIEYLTYGGVVTARQNGTVINNVTIAPPTAGNSNTLTITLPPDTKLATNEELVITFDLEMLREVASAKLVPTLLYYFKNQALVSYTDTKVDNYNNFAGYYSTVKSNASGPGPVQVFIDPISLIKTVKNADGFTPEHPVDGPFHVTLRVENSLSDTTSVINTEGIITDLIPKGFTISDKGTLPAATSITTTSDGDTRITIRDVNISDSTPTVEYTYTLAYTGRGYGVLYTDLASDYRYVYHEGGDTMPLDVYLKFPQPVIGIKVKTQNDSFVATGTTSAIFHITENDNFSERLTDGNYDVTPEIVLFDNAGTVASKNANGDYQINHTSYTAILLRSTNALQFTPKPGSDGTYEFDYQIMLNATKPGGTPESFDLNSSKTKITINVTGTGSGGEDEDHTSGGGITSNSAIDGGEGDDSTGATFPLNPVALAALPIYILSRNEKFKSIRLGDKHAKGK